MSHKDKVDTRRFIVLRPYTSVGYGSNFQKALDEAISRAKDSGETQTIYEITLMPHSQVNVTREVEVTEAKI